MYVHPSPGLTTVVLTACRQRGHRILSPPCARLGLTCAKALKLLQFQRAWSHGARTPAGSVLATYRRMRIALSLCIAFGMSVGASHLVVAGQPKYGVTVRTLNRDGLARAKTYDWIEGQVSPDKDIDALIVAAVDRELAMRGLAKIVSGRGDVEVTYRSLSRTDVTATKDRNDPAFREFAVGTLIVDVTDRVSRQLLFGARMDTPIERDPATLATTINGAVTAMFEKYPYPTPPKR